MNRMTFHIVFPLACLILGGCDPKQPNIEIIQDMMDQDSVKAQDYEPKKSDGLAMRIPPKGTIPINFEAYIIKDVDEASSKLKNPNADLVTRTAQEQKDVLERGRFMFDTYCAICHGPQGKGDGAVADKMLIKRPPSLLVAPILGYKDGRYFHVISQGYGVMSSYAGQVGKFEDRWAIVTWIRQLQKMN
ncbi:MAG: c-type cytochrome [Pseudomonadota bacterium]|nr:c-type cytochrome [Pseudomonadota bacterium]